MTPKSSTMPKLISLLCIATGIAEGEDWVSLPPMPEAKYGLGCTEINGVVYVAGGWESQTFHAYTVATSDWSSPLPPMPGNGWMVPAAALNHLLYAGVLARLNLYGTIPQRPSGTTWHQRRVHCGRQLSPPWALICAWWEARLAAPSTVARCGATNPRRSPGRRLPRRRRRARIMRPLRSTMVCSLAAAPTQIRVSYPRWTTTRS